MHPILITFIITLIIVYVVDYVRFIPNALSKLYTLIFNKEIQPDNIRLPYILTCSLCLTTWTTLITLLFIEPTYVPMSFIYGWSTQHILKLYTLIDNVINYIFYKLNKPFE